MSFSVKFPSQEAADQFLVDCGDLLFISTHSLGMRVPVWLEPHSPKRPLELMDWLMSYAGGVSTKCKIHVGGRFANDACIEFRDRVRIIIAAGGYMLDRVSPPLG